MESSISHTKDPSQKRTNDKSSPSPNEAPISRQPPHHEEQKNATVILLCGLPGSGKSTLASWMLNMWEVGNNQQQQKQHHDDVYSDGNSDDDENIKKEGNAQDSKKKDLQIDEHQCIKSLQKYDRVVLIDYDKLAQGISPSSSSLSKQQQQQQNNNNEKKEMNEKNNSVSSFSKRSFVFTEEDLEAWRKSRSMATQAVESELSRHFFGDDDEEEEGKIARPGVIVRERKKYCLSSSKINSDAANDKSTDQLQKSENRRLLIILDDNFHLRSMRRDIYKICRSCVGDLCKLDTISSQQQQNTMPLLSDSSTTRHSSNNEAKNKVSFGIIMVDTPLELCLERNKYRAGIDCIPDDIVLNMSHTFERPASKKAKFESSSVIVNSPDNKKGSTEKYEEKSIIQAIETCLHNTAKQPIPPPMDEEAEQKRQNEERNKTLASRVHRYDRLLRVLVGASCRVLDKKYARHINEVRRLVLSRIKDGTMYNDDENDNVGDIKVLMDRFDIRIESNVTEGTKDETEHGVVIIYDEDDAAVIRRFLRLVLMDDDDNNNEGGKTNNGKENHFSSLLESIETSCAKFHQSYHSTK